MNSETTAAPQSSTEDQLKALELRSKVLNHRANVAKDMVAVAFGIAATGFVTALAYRTFTAPDEALNDATPSK